MTILIFLQNIKPRIELQFCTKYRIKFLEYYIIEKFAGIDFER